MAHDEIILTLAEQLNNRFYCDFDSKKPPLCGNYFYSIQAEGFYRETTVSFTGLRSAGLDDLTNADDRAAGILNELSKVPEGLHGSPYVIHLFVPQTGTSARPYKLANSIRYYLIAKDPEALEAAQNVISDFIRASDDFQKRLHKEQTFPPSFDTIIKQQLGLQ